MKKISNFILVAVSYRCNASCTYCYANKTQAVFDKDMSLADFIKIVNLLKKNGGDSLGIIGGEPTIWKFLGEAILYCKIKGIKTTVFTNGLRKIPAIPDYVYLNISQFFTSSRNQFKKVLEFYRKKNIRIVFRYNFNEENLSAEELKDVITLAKENSNVLERIDLVPISPYKIEKKLGEKTYETARIILQNGIGVKLANPIPPCVFSDEQRIFLRKNCGYYSRCNLGTLPLVNPDGKTVQICSKIASFKKLRDFEGRFPANSKEVFKKRISIIEARENLPFKKCEECDFLKKGDCVGGCLAFKSNVVL
jgi:organic radical activating enzyme